MKSFVKPTPEQLASVKAIIGSAEHELYFFNNLENPLWIEPLSKAGFFTVAPPLQHEGGGTRWVNWPASQYLARMAAFAPEEVFEILTHIETDNPSVHHDFLDAAKNMPATVAAKFVPKLLEGLNQSTWPIDVRDAAEICQRLANEGHADAAFEIAHALFTWVPNENKSDSRRDEYWYVETAKMTFSALLNARPKDLISASLDWLDTILSNRRTEIERDRSDIWRPAIEKHEQNQHHSFPSTFIDVIRDTLESSIQNELIELPDVLSLLGKHRHDFFRRLQLHLLTEFGEQYRALASDFIMKKPLFKRSRYVHEYSRLVGRHLGALSSEDRSIWFGWIESGPGFEHYEPEEQEARKKYWQFRRLHWVRLHLSGHWKGAYDAMLSQFGEPELADLNMVSSTKWGNDSPFSLEQLKEMGEFQEMVAKLASWRPPVQRFDGPNRQGLLSTFGQYVTANALECSKSAVSLQEFPADIVRTFINSMETAVRDGNSIEISAVLALSLWVVGRPMHERTTPAGDREPLIDPDWQWSVRNRFGFHSKDLRYTAHN